MKRSVRTKRSRTILKWVFCLSLLGSFAGMVSIIRVAAESYGLKERFATALRGGKPDETLPEGTEGRMYIRGWSVPLYTASFEDPDRMQEIVDAPQSASWTVTPEGITHIADHAGQGFRLIKSLKAGDTFFVIKDGEKHTYRCVSYYGDAYRDSEGHGFLPDGRDYVDEGDTAIVTQTCNDATGNSVTVQYWIEE